LELRQLSRKTTALLFKYQGLLEESTQKKLAILAKREQKQGAIPLTSVFKSEVFIIAISSKMLSIFSKLSSISFINKLIFTLSDKATELQESSSGLIENIVIERETIKSKQQGLDVKFDTDANKIFLNCIVGVMVSMLVSCVAEHGFQPLSDITSDYKIGICCFSAKYACCNHNFCI
jgi:hypothetical protein